MTDGKENGRGQGGRVENAEPNVEKARGGNTAADHTHLIPSFEAMQPYRGARLDLIPLHRWDTKDRRGRELGKAPADRSWTTRPYEHKRTLEQAQRQGINLGVRLPADVVVLDVDTRHFPDGHDILAEFVAVTQIDLTIAPHVITGNGHHYYFRKPADVVLLDTLEPYPGLEFKSLGRQIVAAGSIHPSGAFYKWALDSPPLAEMPDMPASILLMARRPERKTASASTSGEITPEQLAKTLQQLEPENFRDHGRWLDLMMACHHATAGDGRQDFIDWSTQDPEYADDAWRIGRRWDSLHENRDDAIRIGTLRMFLNEVGGDIVPCDPEDDFDAWTEDDNETSVEKASRWRFLSIEEVKAMPPPKWLVHGLLVEGSLAAIYGAPESGKSFLALDMAMAVAAGVNWHGRNVIGGGVLYIAAEGAPGFGKRLIAWETDRQMQTSEIRLRLMSNELNLAAKGDTARDFAEAANKEIGPLKLIIIDTLNQTATGADENSAMDMGRYVASMKRIRDATGAAVVVVHHSGKDVSKGMRGSTALLGAMDTTIDVARSTDRRSITVSVQKQKDAEREAPMRFNLEKVANSLVLRATVMADAAQDFGGKPKPIVELACQLANEHGGSFSLKELVDAVSERDGASDKTARRHIEEAILEGKDNAVAAADGTLIWLERIGNNPRGAMKVQTEHPA